MELDYMNDSLKIFDMQSTFAASIWAVRASVVQDRPYGPLGLDRRRGSKHLRAGAKVWVIDGFWGMGAEQVTVVGRHRATLRYIKIIIPIDHLDGFRAGLVYSPKIAALIGEHFAEYGSALDNEAAAIKAAASYSDIASALRIRTPSLQIFQVVAGSDGQPPRIWTQLPSGELDKPTDIPLKLVPDNLRHVGAILRVATNDIGPNRFEAIAP